jgi:2'-5' RNA ligase
MRLFIAINFNELKDYFADLQKQIPRQDAKLTFPKDFHLTLKFLGEVDEKNINEIKRLLFEIKFSQFQTDVTDIGFFSEDFLRTVWIKADSKEIYDLQKQIDEKLVQIPKTGT